MNIAENYKKQATRLSAFMHENFRVSVKRTAALEAIATISGFRNWQTMLASAVEQVVAPAVALARQYTLAWRRGGEAGITVDENVWRRHTMVTGTEQAREGWFIAQVQEHQEAGRSGLFVGLPLEFVNSLRKALSEPVARGLHVISLEELQDRAMFVPLSQVLQDVVNSTSEGGVWCIAQARTRDEGEILRQLVGAVADARAKTGIESKEGFTVASLSEQLDKCIPVHVLYQGRATRLTALVGIGDESPLPVADANTYSLVDLSGVSYRMFARIRAAADAGPVVLAGNGRIQA